MKHFWSFLFFLVPLFGVATFVFAPHFNIWLPRDISEQGRVIDGLFMFILYLTGAVFIVTESVLFYYLWKYNGKSNDQPVKFSHGSHALELVWTIIPAVTLLFIAIYQMQAWAADKLDAPAIDYTCEVTGRQFNWDFRYPGPDNELYTQDDIVRTDGKLYLPVNEEILLKITSADVLHSFFLPNLRVKQDVVPGMAQKMWFKGKKTGGYDIVCAELCGWGHYKMKGRVFFLPRDEYDAKLAEFTAEQETMTVEVPEEE
ncbi:cytochrome c oxidase subunit II [Bythopirellula polymerisocia]|uniref:Cytochrome c oxidase subunit 2 n=1 Tax=Bythopirellula polymerisocia TaxID=2528003 RepID=A0A5C6CJB0_9BACT|nr:cytochrome c oxidase subunit II [Bythopirellula polymerisocia]TWU23564.1 Cytochrome c oxidase subunit 2 precursor [Bythopirellula polymerisocia]